MITQKNSVSKVTALHRLFWVYILISFAACSPDLRDDSIPFIPFSPIVLNLNLPGNISLRTDGGYKTLSSKEGGVQGIIIYRIDNNTYMAYERNCSYHPNDACVTVELHSSGLYMQDPCCSSYFSLATGAPTGGPAWRPLRQYQTSLINSELTITDEIVE